MPNHWHFVLWPERDGDLSAFIERLTNTHVKRWKEHRHERGDGHLYQERYKCFPVQTEEYFYRAVRYVERNALRANLVSVAQQWRWSNLWHVASGAKQSALVSDWPLTRPEHWLQIVNQPQSDAELAALRRSVNRGSPYGTAEWVDKIARTLGLEFTLRPRGRPKKAP